ncbi:MAG: hypothetical protein ACOCXZ_02855 [Chloroflexota bacterium]
MRRIVIPFTLLFALLLLVDAYPGLRGGAGWRWPYHLPDNWLPLALLAGLLLLYVSGAVALRRYFIVYGHAWPALTWAVLGGAAIALGVVGVRGDPLELLFIRTVSPVQTGAATVSVRYFAMEGLQQSLENWPALMRASVDTNLIHFTTSPPGQPLVHYWIASALEPLTAITRPVSYALRTYQCSNPDVMAYTRAEITGVGVVGLLMPLWASLLALPVYSAACRLSGNQLAGLRLAQWTPLIPSILLFMPVWNTLYPTLAALSFALLVMGLQARTARRRRVLVVAAGAVMSALTFLNFAALPVLGIFGLFTLGWWWRDESSSEEDGLEWPVAVGLWFGLGLLVCWVPFGLATGHTPLDLFAISMEKHGTLVQRDPLPWLLLHPYDTLLFMGWPLAALFIAGAVRALRRLAWTSRRPPVPSAMLGLVTLIIFLLVNMLGLVQGENGRILSFYAPFMLLAGAGWLRDRSSRFDLPLMGAQAFMVLAMAAALPVVPLDLDPPPQQPRRDIATLDTFDPIAADQVFDSADFNGILQLDAYRYVADINAQTITLQTEWTGIDRTERPYEFVVIARAENAIDGAIVTPPQRWLAQNGNFPPTCWRAGDRIIDVRVIDLPLVSAPVQWTLDLQLIDPRTGDVMRAHMPDGPADRVRIGPINYP